MTSDTAATRKSLPLSARDLADIELLRSRAERRELLSEITGSPVPASISEARLLQLVLEAGFRALEERAEQAAYVEIAADYDALSRKRSARRRSPSWGDDE